MTVWYALWFWTSCWYFWIIQQWRVFSKLRNIPVQRYPGCLGRPGPLSLENRRRHGETWQRRRVKRASSSGLQQALTAVVVVVVRGVARVATNLPGTKPKMIRVRKKCSNWSDGIVTFIVMSDHSTNHQTGMRVHREVSLRKRKLTNGFFSGKKIIWILNQFCLVGRVRTGFIP